MLVDCHFMEALDAFSLRVFHASTNLLLALRQHHIAADGLSASWTLVRLQLRGEDHEAVIADDVLAWTQLHELQGLPRFTWWRLLHLLLVFCVRLGCFCWLFCFRGEVFEAYYAEEVTILDI